MKRALLLFLAVGFVVSAMAQFQPPKMQGWNNTKAPAISKRIDGTVPGLMPANPYVSTKAVLDDPVVAQSRYDLQSNASMQHRIYLYDDGTMGAVATMSHTDTYTDRGTGYNFFDGTAWGSQPSTRIETVRTGWPSYAPLGANGEIVIAHQSGTTPLIVSRRTTKGTGAWTQTELGPPAGASGMLWCRMVTSGPDRNNIHVICLTSPTGNGGVVWNNLNGALVYNRSLDGGETWDGWLLLDGMTSADYLGFGGDAYCWAEPSGNTLAFIVGDNWNDQFIMKSTDNGDTWSKIVIWPCPYNLWAGGDTTGMFWAPDGCSAGAIGPDGNVHVLFGLQRANGDETGGKSWYPYTEGLIYWNETMPELPAVLDPDELIANGNYIAWVQDTMVYYEGTLAYYYNSMTSFPSIVVDEDNYVFALWSGVTTFQDPDGYLLRHIYGRGSTDGGATWEDNFYDITGGFLYQWSECAYLSAASRSTDRVYLVAQIDDLAGDFLQSTNSGYQGQMSPSDNFITVFEPKKTDILYPVAIQSEQAESFNVSQVMPNPVHNNAVLHVNTNLLGTLTCTVFNTLGQPVYNISKGFVPRGNHQFNLNASNLNAGVYYVSIMFNNEKALRKMIVE